MKQSTKTLIIVGVIVLVILIGIGVYASKPSKTIVAGISAANPKNVDLSKLSPADLATYNSLPNDAAKADFLNILSTQGKVVPATTTTGTQNSPATQIVDFFKGLFGKKKVVYTQTPPIDDQGYDIFGCNAAGFESDGTPCA